MILISQLENEHYPALPHATSWLVIVVGEVLILSQTIVSFRLAPKNDRWNKWQIAQVSVASFRIVWTGIMSAIWLLLYWLYKRHEKANKDSSEGASLLGESSESQTPNGYGATQGSKDGEGKTDKKEEAQADGWARRTKTPEGAWYEYIKGYTIFFPYLWPSKDRKLQVVMVICFILVFLQRGINVLIPDQLGKITDILSGESGEDGKFEHQNLMVMPLLRLYQLECPGCRLHCTFCIDSCKVTWVSLVHSGLCYGFPSANILTELYQPLLLNMSIRFLWIFISVRRRERSCQHFPKVDQSTTSWKWSLFKLFLCFSILEWQSFISSQSSTLTMHSSLSSSLEVTYMSRFVSQVGDKTSEERWSTNHERKMQSSM